MQGVGAINFICAGKLPPSSPLDIFIAGFFERTTCLHLVLKALMHPVYVFGQCLLVAYVLIPINLFGPAAKL